MSTTYGISLNEVKRRIETILNNLKETVNELEKLANSIPDDLDLTDPNNMEIWNIKQRALLISSSLKALV